MCICWPYHACQFWALSILCWCRTLGKRRLQFRWFVKHRNVEVMLSCWAISHLFSIETNLFEGFLVHISSTRLCRSFLQQMKGVSTTRKDGDSTRGEPCLVSLMYCATIIILLWCFRSSEPPSFFPAQVSLEKPLDMIGSRHTFFEMLESWNFVDCVNPYLPTAQKVWKTPCFVSPWSIELTIDQWILVDIDWPWDRGKAKRKDYSYDWTLNTLELLLVVPMVLS